MPVVAILGKPDADQYFFPTTTGKSAMATLKIRNTTNHGILALGINESKKEIYHLMFHAAEPIERVRSIIHNEKTVQEINEEGSEEMKSIQGFQFPKKKQLFRQGETYIVHVDKDNTCAERELQIKPWRDC